MITRKNNQTDLAQVAPCFQPDNTITRVAPVITLDLVGV